MVHEIKNKILESQWCGSFNIVRNENIQKSSISWCQNLGKTKVFKKDPKIFEFQWCESVNILGNKKSKLLFLTKCDDLEKATKSLKNPTNPSNNVEENDK